MINPFHKVNRLLKGLLLFAAWILVCTLCSCSVFTPNPGENEADTFIQHKQYDKAIAIVEPLAEQGIPWAQLRLGIAYEYGQGKPQSATQALTLYKKVATQIKELPWADGVQIISSGKKGYFNQNNDAKVAQYLLARLYAQGTHDAPKNLPEAWHWATHVLDLSHKNDILFCCENSRLKTQYIEFSRIEKLLLDIEKLLSPEELAALQAGEANWTPQ